MQDINNHIKSSLQKEKSLIEIYNDVSNKIAKVDFYRQVLQLIECNEIPNVLICYCGHDCARCRTFLATLADDIEAKKSIAEYYKTNFNQDIQPAKFHCLSGKSDEIMEGCLQCPYMACSKQKNLSSCSKCRQYPCESLDWYIKNYVNKANQI